MASAAAGQEIGDQSKVKVFISYSRKDMAFADRLEAALKARGFEPPSGMIRRVANTIRGRGNGNDRSGQ